MSLNGTCQAARFSLESPNFASLSYRERATMIAAQSPSADAPLPYIVRSLAKPIKWLVYDARQDFVAAYRTRERARRWMLAAGYDRWREESWEQRQCFGTPRATSHIARRVRQ